MSQMFAVQTPARRTLAVAAALATAAMAATPLVMGASRALATSGEAAPVTSLHVAPADVAAVAAPKAEDQGAPCVRKIRVVYGGYGTSGPCAAR